MSEMMAAAAAQTLSEIKQGDEAMQISHIPADHDRWDPAGRVLVLSGSWNPPHAGHVALLRSGSFQHRVALLSTYNADKPPISRQEILDRLRMVELAVPDCYAVATNVPLLVSQAALFRKMWPSSRLTFAMGWDTWTRFNDSSYLGMYHESAVKDFFRHHNVVVGTRDSMTPAQAMLELRDHPYRMFVTLVDPLGTKDMSSTHARMFLSKGRLPPHLDPAVYGYALAAGLYRDAEPG